jgi:rRNA maturation endonuclease Nob1
MKQIIYVILILIFFQSCGKEDFYSDGNFYKMVDKEKKYEIDLTFLNDSIIALNLDSLKTCGWNFAKYSRSKKGIFLINEEKLDTTWLKMEDEKLVMQSSLGKNNFYMMDFNSKKKDSIREVVCKVQKFSNKKIIFSCDINLDEVPYFYDNAIEEVKLNLKNPNTAKFNEVYIHAYNDFVKQKLKETEIKVVSVEVEATNSFGGFTVSTFYVYFVPDGKNSKKYSKKFSNSSIYSSVLNELEEIGIE